MKHPTLLYMLTGISVISSFLFVVWALAFHAIPDANRELFIHLMGIIEGSFVGGLVATFFGSSKREHEPNPDNTIELNASVSEEPTAKGS